MPAATFSKDSKTISALFRMLISLKDAFVIVVNNVTLRLRSE
jgi:hypothetical protein